MTILLGFIWAALVGWLGSTRKIGFLWSFLASIFLTPIVGLIITLCSSKVDTLEEDEVDKTNDISNSQSTTSEN